MIATGSAKLLVVDDEVDTCHNLRDILNDVGFEVDVAHSGEEALALFQERHYDVALLDLKMPGMSGLELYQRIKEMGRGTVAIIVTAYATHETAHSALKAGAWKVLTKPVELGRLLDLISEAVSRPLVMVVDDDRDLCANLIDLLRDKGFRVCVAHSTEEAGDRVKIIDAQVVMIDMRLPGGDGSEVFRMVRTANPQARTILITGHRGELERQIDAVLSDGADAICYKPFDMSNLLTTLHFLSGKAS